MNYPQPQIVALSHLHALFRSHAKDLSLSVDCLSSGPIDASIAFVSTAPGESEVRLGVPFSGVAGNLLWTSCRPYHFNRNNVYVTNVVKRSISSRLGEESTGITAPEFNLYSELLKWELSLLPNLQFILILGNEALDALRPSSALQGKVLNWRGSWISGITLQGKTVDALVTVNPALVARCNSIIMGTTSFPTEPSISRRLPLKSAQRIFESDIRKFKLLTEGKLHRYEVTSHINPTFAYANSFLDAISNSPDPISVDVETRGGQTACIGFGLSPHEAMCIPFINSDMSHYWSFEDEKVLRLKMSYILAGHSQSTVQFGNFDTLWLWHIDRLYSKFQFDTLLAHHTLYPSLPHSLEFLCSIYTTHPYYKSEKDSWKAINDIDRFWTYNCTDCAITLAVRNALTSELSKANLLDFFLSHVMRATPHLMRMCEGGVKIDLEYRDALKEKLERELSIHLENFFNSLRDYGFDDDYRPNPRSFKDLGELFFRKLKLVGRGTSTNFANRKRMFSHVGTSTPARNIITQIDTYLKAAKFYSTYVDTKLDDDGRYRCSYLQSGTQESPGRLSSSSTPWETGGNLQNQPHSAYSLFVVEPGYCFIYFDLEQAEARVVGWEANIQSWINDFEKARIEGGYDCHRALCSAMWNIPYAETPVDDIDETGQHTKRYIAKRCRHGLNYRMYFIKLAEVTGLSITAAHEAYTRYHKITPELKHWWDDLTVEVTKTKILTNAFGRRWVLTEPMSESTLESIVAFKPQSTIGDKVVQVIYQSEDDDEWPKDARIAMNIHDALIGIAPIAKADTCLQIMKKYAEQPIYIKNRPPLIIPASLKKTTNATAFRTLSNGDIEFYEHEQGYHRWSSLAKVAMRELLTSE